MGGWGLIIRLLGSGYGFNDSVHSLSPKFMV